MGEKHLILIICLCILFYFHGAAIQDLGSDNQVKMESKIYLVPVGDIEGGILEALRREMNSSIFLVE